MTESSSTNDLLTNDLLTNDLLTKIYAAFNQRDIDTVLANMAADVDWPNGMEGGRVHGHEAVRQYWLRQWSQINPRVEPQGFRADPSGGTIVDVHQVIRDLEGNVLMDRMVEHVYFIRDGLVQSMEIREN
ncbi:MAG TPA: nuclear transport factor 2 family protein [Candidatus Angelobacter sp.]